MVEPKDNFDDSDEEENSMTKEEATDRLFAAVKAGNVEDAKFILEKGFNNATEIKDGWNPLLWASCNGNEELVRLLIKHQAHTPYQKSQKMLDEQNNNDKSTPNLNSEEGADPFVKPPDS